MNDPVQQPAMSVILVTPDRFERLSGTVAALRRQTVANLLELVVVAPSRSEAAVDEKGLSAFAGHRIVETGPTSSSAGGAPW